MTTQGEPALAQTSRPRPADAPAAVVPAARSGGRVEPDTAGYPEGVDRLVDALNALRDTISGVRYPLVLPEAERATAAAAAIRAQLDDYLLPRLARLDAPLLVVVGGSTGAGKSTLVNSLVGAPVSEAGVLRPTTRAPVLVCHPDDAAWFGEARLLPGLARTTDRPSGTDSLQVVTAPSLTPGLALLDAPDIDSVVEANRALAAQLLAAADLWLFVTTAARYADAVPWELLRTARDRGTAVALVLDRVPPGAADAIGPHLTGMLRAADLGGTPLFVLPETDLEPAGLLTDRIVAPLRAWFAALARSAAARAAVVRQTVDGAIAALGPAVERLAAAATEQVDTADTLAAGVTAAYRAAEAGVEQGVRDGALLRGEVLARWQDLVGTGDLMRGLQARVGRARDRMVAMVTGRPEPGQRLQAALGSGLVVLVRDAAAEAAERVVATWRAHPAGAALVDRIPPGEPTAPDGPAQPGATAPAGDLPERIERLVRDWQRGVLDLVRAEAGDKRALARAGAFAVNATGLLVMVSVFVATSFIPTGVEIAVAGGTTVAAQKVLEAIFGDQAIRTLADKARRDLLARIHELFAAEADHFLSVLDNAGIDPTAADRLRRAAAAAEAARTATPLPGGTGLPQPTLNGAQP
ncbi:ABC transporter [Planosporangium sp. 12N6]|uniref:ABC transporter n=1 Tax=Planosporangium spinosum TaxID=3402278 RepID=UPI003CF735A6